METLTLSSVTFDRAYNAQISVTFPYMFGRDAMAARALDVAEPAIVSALMKLDGAHPSERADYVDALITTVTQSEIDPLRFSVRTR